MRHPTNALNAVSVVSRGVQVVFPRGSFQHEKMETRAVRTGDYNCMVRKGEQLIAHGVDHGSAYRVVRDEETSVDRRRVVLLDATRYQRDKQEVPICAPLAGE